MQFQEAIQFPKSRAGGLYLQHFGRVVEEESTILQSIFFSCIYKWIGISTFGDIFITVFDEYASPNKEWSEVRGRGRHSAIYLEREKGEFSLVKKRDFFSNISTS